MTTATELEPLTKRQQQIFDFIVSYRAKKGYCCTVREVAESIGSTNVTAAMCHLYPLRKKGYVTWNEGESRTLRPTPEALA